MVDYIVDHFGGGVRREEGQENLELRLSQVVWLDINHRKIDKPRLIMAGEKAGFSFVGVSIVDSELIGHWRQKDATDTCIRYKSRIAREEETINRRRVKAQARGERKSLQWRTRGAGHKWSSYIFEHEFTRREWDKKDEASLQPSVDSSTSASAS